MPLTGTSLLLINTKKKTTEKVFTVRVREREEAIGEGKQTPIYRHSSPKPQPQKTGNGLQRPAINSLSFGSIVM